MAMNIDRLPWLAVLASLSSVIRTIFMGRDHRARITSGCALRLDARRPGQGASAKRERNQAQAVAPENQ
ncbi:MAG TPA: hypothetical protein VI251_00850 [Pseudolabrys sp.]